jgi:hypothetical protein
MSDGELPTIPATRQAAGGTSDYHPITDTAAAIPGRSRRGAITGKLRTALDLMVWSGERRAEHHEVTTDGQRTV